ncbi:hypothetical protein HNP33_001221 [Comamonas odontotermitis]|uniref:Uncharacterized protein n=1 Tax=Comamonas odontotermitis TaxID=379895 RepID=A0ABR6RDE2_9BURK|nr:hypothetical protein [Comamonas odontotermitis]
MSGCEGKVQTWHIVFRKGGFAGYFYGSIAPRQFA